MYEICGLNLLTYRSQVHRYPQPQSRIAAFAEFICYIGIEPN